MTEHTRGPVVEPETAPPNRPWPWAGQRTPKLRAFADGERRLMGFFMWVSIAMVVGIIVVMALTLDGFRPPLMDPAPVPAAESTASPGS